MASHDPEPDVTLTSSAIEHLLDDTEVKRGLPRDDAPPWSTHHLRGTDTGPGLSSCPNNGCEPSSSDGTSVRTPFAIDLGHGLVEITSTIGLDPEDVSLDLNLDNADIDTVGVVNKVSRVNNGPHNDGDIGKLFLAYLSRSTQPPCDEQPGYYHTQVELTDDGVDDGDEPASPRPHLMAVEPVAVEDILQYPDLVPTRNTVYSLNCVTETLCSTELRIGWDDKILRWRKGALVTYVMLLESFPPLLAAVVEDHMKKAISMWQDTGVIFKQVPRDCRATFAVRFEGGNFKKGYALSFLPETGPAALLVYEKSLSMAGYLANILAHELGHILGLRHGFAHKRREPPSVFIGSEDDRSVMQYYNHPGEHKVSERDLQGLRAFYELDQPEYQGFEVVIIEPELHDYNAATITSHAT
ncbi:hypothetical protein MKX07_004758 [Trichoderma sp. CBMAI-0711]|nr:hypothetical protein MKX07_004758 [Trichoderma sp. CBMAI-0711]